VDEAVDETSISQESYFFMEHVLTEQQLRTHMKGFKVDY